MSKGKQQRFGHSEIVKSHKSGICDCGKSSFLIIKSRYVRSHYCKNCARNSWIKEVKELEE